jgi:hypothetical protein
MQNLLVIATVAIWGGIRSNFGTKMELSEQEPRAASS